MNENDLAFINARIARIIERVEALEGARQCSDSHAPSSAGSGGTNGGPSGISAEPPKSTPTCSSTTSAADVVAASDSARRALLDPLRPAWFTDDAASTLPEGVERVYRVKYHGGPRLEMAAHPGQVLWTNTSQWRIRSAHEMWYIGQDCEVYHLPPAAKGERACCHTGSVTRHPDPSGNNDVLYTCDGCGAFLKREAWLNQPGKAPAKGEARVPESALIAQAVPGLEAERERLAGRRDAKPDAGRAEGVKCPRCGEPADKGRTAYWCPNLACKRHIISLIEPPAPKPSPGEVAEGIVKRWLAYGATSPGTAQQLMASITAAIERDREGR